MAAQPRNRRKQIIVDAAVQKKMVARSTVAPLAVLLIGAIAMLMLSEQAFDQVEEFETGSGFSLLIAFTIGYIVITSAVAIWLALRQSHRVVGPAYRLQKCIERIRSGDLDFEVTLRDGDHLNDLADEVSRLLVYLREREASGVADAAASNKPELSPAVD